MKLLAVCVSAVFMIAARCAHCASLRAEASLSAGAELLVGFEAAEHMTLGTLGFARASFAHRSQLQAYLKEGWENGEVRLEFMDSGEKLLYGEVTAFAGDLFGVPETPICQGVDDADKEARFRAAFDTLRNAPKLDAIRAAVASEFAKMREFIGRGKASRSAYESLDMFKRHNMKLTVITDFEYLKLASVNFDHFGHDAVAAYKAGHVDALRTALDAHHDTCAESKARKLHLALAKNAWADHYLTDLFAPGHLRSPRRALHYGCSNQGPIQAALRVTAGDEFSKNMHDEDNQIGLVFQNSNPGDRNWIGFGDTKLLHHAAFAKETEQMVLEGNMNVIMAVRAVRESVTDVINVFLRGTLDGWTPETTHAAAAFQSLRTAPDVDKTRALNLLDHPPLFVLDRTTNSEGEVIDVIKRRRKSGRYDRLSSHSCRPGFVKPHESTEAFLADPDMQRRVREEIAKIDHLAPLVTVAGADGTSSALDSDKLEAMHTMYKRLAASGLQSLQAKLQATDSHDAVAKRREVNGVLAPATDPVAAEAGGMTDTERRIIEEASSDGITAHGQAAIEAVHKTVERATAEDMEQAEADTTTEATESAERLRAAEQLSTSSTNPELKAAFKIEAFVSDVI